MSLTLFTEKPHISWRPIQHLARPGTGATPGQRNVLELELKGKEDLSPLGITNLSSV
jgi:hypothetical protein